MRAPSKYLNIQLRTSPHLGRALSVDVVMRNVVYALLPLVAAAYYVFGLSALLVIVVTTACALLTEWVGTRISGKPSTLGDWSAAITGLLLGLTLPPGFPLWMAAAGGVISITLGKQIFGGLGFNVFNPALVGRAFLQGAFPVAITTWMAPFAPDRLSHVVSSTLALPFMSPVVDAASGATPLSAMKFDHVLAPTAELLMGAVSGSAGETSAVLILLGGLYLAYRKMLDWRIPVGVLATVAILTAILHWANPANPTVGFMLFSGGLMLGAVYMATDMVTSPVTPIGVWLFAVLIGVVTVVVRLWGGLPEGVMYAILLSNAATPLLNLITQPRIYGRRKRA